MSTSPTETAAARFTSALSQHITGPVADDVGLAQLGLDSLTLVRIVAHVLGEDSDREIDLRAFWELRTVAEFRQWLVVGEPSPDATAVVR
jgi:hypothetical protein